MKAAVAQEGSLADLAGLDAELARLAHRRTHLPEQARHDELSREHLAASDRLAATRLALEDLDTEIAKFESEIDGVRKREDRDRALMQSGTTNPKQLNDLQHELEVLERRQSNLEDSLLEVMERREELQRDESGHMTAIDGVQGDLSAVQKTLDDARAEIDATTQDREQHREKLVATLDPELVALYQRQRAATGVGAGVLQGKRCGACRIELDRGEIARISAAADDDVLQCPECRAILLRVAGLRR